MALDWIKWIDGLERKRQVVAMAIALKPTGNFRHDCDLVAVGWMRVWNWAGKQTVDGHVLGVPPAVVDDVAGLPGFAAAAERVKWLLVTTEGLSFHDWSEHNGDAEKKRADANRRQRQKRERDRLAKAAETEDCHKNVTGARDMSRGRIEENRREEIQGISVFSAAEPFQPDAAVGLPPQMPGFFRVHNAYPPHRRNKNRQESERLWVDMNLEPKTDAVLAGLEAWKASSQWRGGMIERMDNFLKDSMWENPPTENTHGPDHRDQPNRRPSPEDARRQADRAQRVGGGEVGAIPILGRRSAG